MCDTSTAISFTGLFIFYAFIKKKKKYFVLLISFVYQVKIYLNFKVKKSQRKCIIFTFIYKGQLRFLVSNIFDNVSSVGTSVRGVYNI